MDCSDEVLRDVCIQRRDRLASLLNAHIRVAPDLDTLRPALDASVEQETLSAGLADADRESFGVRVVEVGHAFARQRQPVEDSLGEIKAVAGCWLVFVHAGNLATWWLRNPCLLQR